MFIETERLAIHTMSEDEMRGLVERQTDKELKNGTHIGDLCFKGLKDDGSVEIGYGITEENQGKGYATEAIA